MHHSPTREFIPRRYARWSGLRILQPMDIAIRPTRVFLVDDSAIIRERLIEMIEALPNATLAGEADNAAAAIQGIKHTDPDCVVLDLQLRNSNGLTVLRDIHPAMPDVVFLVFTNHSSAPYCQLCLSAGARYFFDKSVDIERIRDALTSIASTHAAN